MKPHLILFCGNSLSINPPGQSTKGVSPCISKFGTVDKSSMMDLRAPRWRFCGFFFAENPKTLRFRRNVVINGYNIGEALMEDIFVTLGCWFAWVLSHIESFCAFQTDLDLERILRFTLSFWCKSSTWKYMWSIFNAADSLIGLPVYLFLAALTLFFLFIYIYFTMKIDYQKELLNSLLNLSLFPPDFCCERIWHPMEQRLEGFTVTALRLQIYAAHSYPTICCIEGLVHPITL